jgi:Ca-activated chloride channel family protein
MRFLRPDLLSWSIVLPLLVASWSVHAHLRRRFRQRTAIDRRVAPSSRRSTWRRDAAALGAALVMASAIVFALMRPQLLLAARVPDYERQDLVVMLDRSVSMRARDLTPSRFARATRELRTLLRDKPEASPTARSCCRISLTMSRACCSIWTGSTKNRSCCSARTSAPR